MKIAIDNGGHEVEVSDDTVVDTINGVHHLLTPERQAEEVTKAAIYANGATYRVLMAVYAKRDASLAMGGYGTYGEQFDIMYHQGMDAWKAHIEQVKINNPKPE